MAWEPPQQLCLWLWRPSGEGSRVLTCYLYNLLAVAACLLWCAPDHCHCCPPFDCCCCQVLLPREERQVALGIWDSSGYPPFRHISSRFIRGADAVLVCYDPTSRRLVQAQVESRGTEDPGASLLGPVGWGGLLRCWRSVAPTVAIPAPGHLTSGPVPPVWVA